MKIHVEGFTRKPVVHHDFAANEGFEREGGEHVETKTESSNVDHNAIFWEVVEYIPFGERTKG